MKAVFENRLPIRLSSRPDYSDAIGMDGRQTRPGHCQQWRRGDIGKLLLAKAKELKADMIVMGAFHHSRWREFILGGVTLTMLEEATLPLFMAH